MHGYTGRFNINRLFHHANRLFTSHNYKEAIIAYTKLLPECAAIPDVSFNLATSYFHMRNFDKALEYYINTLKLDSKRLKVYCQLGKIYQDKGNIHIAIAAYRRALMLDQGHLAAAIPLAHIYKKYDQCNNARNILYTAVKHNPENFALIFELIDALILLDENQDALVWSLWLLEIHPYNVDVLYNTAQILKKMGSLDAAMRYYRYIVDIDPNHIKAQFDYALALLVTSNQSAEHWTDGWQYYETRWKREHQMNMRHYTQPLWDGSDPTNKTFFLWAEQGLEDTFVFIRYAKILKDRGATRIIMAVQGPLHALAKLCPYIDEVIDLHDEPPYFDYHTPLLSMPHLLKTTLNNVPHEIPYIYADPNLERHWQSTLSKDHHFKIGICWQGDRTVTGRSMNVKQFLPIMDIPGVSVYSLQKMSDIDQTDEAADHLPFHIFGQDLDFMDIAAVMKQLDLVITVDTSICHLAGALGIPVWTLLPTSSDWRWMLHCDDTPWYSTMRLFRQQTSDNWDDVINTVVATLTAHLAGEKPLIYFENSYARHLHTDFIDITGFSLSH